MSQERFPDLRIGGSGGFRVGNAQTEHVCWGDWRNWEEQGSLTVSESVIEDDWEDLGRDTGAPLWGASDASCWVGFGHSQGWGGIRGL